MQKTIVFHLNRCANPQKVIDKLLLISTHK
jgi:hypothetical protein